MVQAVGNTHNGSAKWTYSVPDSAFDFLADSEILTLTYTASVNDGHGGIVTKPLTVTVTGTNDTAVIASAPQIATISEIADTSGSSASDETDGTITFTDVDWTDTHAVTITKVVATGIQTGLTGYNTQFGWLSLGTLADSTGGVTGSQKWMFSAPDHYFDYLADGEAVTLTYTVRVDDHHGGITSQNIAVTVTGSMMRRASQRTFPEMPDCMRLPSRHGSAVRSTCRRRRLADFPRRRFERHAYIWQFQAGVRLAGCERQSSDADPPTRARSRQRAC